MWQRQRQRVQHKKDFNNSKHSGNSGSSRDTVRGKGVDSVKSCWNGHPLHQSHTSYWMQWTLEQLAHKYWPLLWGLPTKTPQRVHCSRLSAIIFERCEETVAHCLWLTTGICRSVFVLPSRERASSPVQVRASACTEVGTLPSSGVHVSCIGEEERALADKRSIPASGPNSTSQNIISV